MTDEIEIPEIKEDNSVKLDIFLHQPKQEQQQEEPISVEKHDDYCSCDDGEGIAKTSLPTFDREPDMDYLDIFSTLSKSIEALADKMVDIEDKLYKMDAAGVNETPTEESQNKEQFQPEDESTSPTSGAPTHAVNAASSKNKAEHEDDEDEDEDKDKDESEEKEDVKKSVTKVVTKVVTPSPMVTGRDGQPNTTYPESESPLPAMTMADIEKMALGGNGIQKLEDHMWKIEKRGN